MEHQVDRPTVNVNIDVSIEESISHQSMQQREVQYEQWRSIQAIQSSHQNVRSNEDSTIQPIQPTQNVRMKDASPACSHVADRWDPISSAIKDIRSTKDSSVSSNPNYLYRNMDLEKISTLFPDDVETVVKVRMSQEQARKNEEWERKKKKRLQQMMALDLEQRRMERERSQQTNVVPKQSKGNSSCGRK